MIFSLDLPYCEVGWGNLHVEDSVLVTATGVECLNDGDVSRSSRAGKNMLAEQSHPTRSRPRWPPACSWAPCFLPWHGLMQCNRPIMPLLLLWSQKRRALCERATTKESLCDNCVYATNPPVAQARRLYGRESLALDLANSLYALETDCRS